MSPRAIPRHSVNESRRRLKAWLIALNFDRFRGPVGPVIFFAENLPMGCDTTYNASRLFRTIWIAPQCNQTTHLLFSRASTGWPRYVRKSYTFARSKPWESLIYHPMSPRTILRYSVHKSRGCLKTWLIGFNFDLFSAPLGPVIFFAKIHSMGCDTTYIACRVFRTIWIAPECHQTT